MMHRMRIQPMHQLNHPDHNYLVRGIKGTTSKSSKLHAMRVPKFLRSLYDILQYEDQSILTWSKDGSYFRIFDTRRLEISVLPKYFKHGKFASFQRQLNNFGFRKWTKTQASVCTFSHHHLMRCHPRQLAKFISRHPPANCVRSVGGAATDTRRTLPTDAQFLDAKFYVHYSQVNGDGRTNEASCVPRWTTDPKGFLKSNGWTNSVNTSIEQINNFSAEGLHDISVPITTTLERHHCSRFVEKLPEPDRVVELEPAVLSATSSSNDLFTSISSTWESDTIFVPVSSLRFDQGRKSLSKE
ncbi:hypothetical protein CCR75_007370 [Bremia lactucae]|uniref:HSF-type DNA-binding domain-containing protein n=1 Tax=Bremia lactucae TaxID=4779 RepID=A0A976FGE1_BRELC|nr:hypothetical protein CCR75_007370 [Bremia lactucae]